MYQFSRAIYRELSPLIDTGPGTRDGHSEVLRACEATIERLATDRHYFAKPARTCTRQASEPSFADCATASTVPVCAVLTR